MENKIAFGSPGVLPKWNSSAKSGVGTAFNAESEVWFTLSHGILNEVYYPRVDIGCMRDMGFMVADGKNFFYIGKTKAAGRSNAKKAYNYAELDDSSDKTLYYRLKQVDTDGQFKYSNTISVSKNGQKMKWAVYPNPAKTTLNIDGSDDLKTARVYNSQGILVHTSNQKAMNISDFSTGFYVLEV